MTQNEAIQAAINAAVSIMEAQVGYIEKASNSQLDDPTANAGSNNFTKYAKYFDDLRDKGILFYNTKKQGGEWCDMDFDWSMCQAFGPELAMQMLYQPKESCGAGCKYSADYYRGHGAFYTSNPQVGDQIFFGKRGSETHTGMVVGVDKAKVYTVEGNTGNACRRKEYYLSDSNIAGYGRPDWALAAHLFMREEKSAEPTSEDAALKEKIGRLMKEDPNFFLAMLGNPRYYKVKELPEWAQAELIPLIEQGYVKGTVAGDTPEETVIDADLATVRCWIISGRMMATEYGE